VDLGQEEALRPRRLEMGWVQANPHPACMFHQDAGQLQGESAEPRQGGTDWRSDVALEQGRHPARLVEERLERGNRPWQASIKARSSQGHRR
jgi:hypothetical protein